MKITIEGENIKVSDGYHTIDELYEHRIIIYIALCKALSDSHNIWKSELHSDETKFEGWFILGINRGIGAQITYHLPIKYWNLCHFATSIFKAPEWDKHTSEDVLERLLEL